MWRDHSSFIHSVVKNSIFRTVTVLLAPTSVLTTSLDFRSQPHRVYKGDQLSPDHPPSVPLSWDAWRGLARLALHPEPTSWPPSWCLGVLRAWRRLGQGGNVTAGPMSWRRRAQSPLWPPWEWDGRFRGKGPAALPPTLQGGFLPLHPPTTQNSCSSSCQLSEVAQNLPKPRELAGTPHHFPLTSHGARPAAGMFMVKPPKSRDRVDFMSCVGPAERCPL